MAAPGPDFATGRVLELIDGATELRTILDSALARQQLVLLDFSVSWCGPCRMLAPVLDGLAAEHAGRVVVVKVDCERTAANRALAASASVSAYPTLKFYADGRDVETARGANPAALRASVARHLAALGPPRPAGGPDLAAALAAALSRVKAGCAPAEFMAAAKTLAAIVGNIVAHPQDPKYRSIKLSNAGYRAKLGSKPGGRECMEVLGFRERMEAMEAVLVMDRVPDNLGTVVGFLSAAIAAAEGSASPSGSGSGAAAAPAPAAPPAPAPPASAAPSPSAQDEGPAASGNTMNLLCEPPDAAAARDRHMAAELQTILRLSASMGWGSDEPEAPEDLPRFSDAPVPPRSGPPPPPPPPPEGLPVVSKARGWLEAGPLDLNKRQWIAGTWFVGLPPGGGLLAAVPPGAPRQWLHLTPRALAGALARAMQQAGLG